MSHSNSQGARPASIRLSSQTTAGFRAGASGTKKSRVYISIAVCIVNNIINYLYFSSTYCRLWNLDFVVQIIALFVWLAVFILQVLWLCVAKAARKASG